MEKTAKLSFCTVTYNSEDKIKNLLDNLEDVTKNYNATIFVVDNGSSDNTIQIIKKYMKMYNNIRLLIPKENKGFGAGNNAVIDYIDSQYHVLVNPDIKISASSELDKMVIYMNEHPNVGLLSPKLLNIDGSVQKLYKYNPSVLDMALRFISPNIMKKRQAWFVHDETGYIKSGLIEHASGAFMFFRTSTFLDIEGFDERYFMYMEDADITRKVNEKSSAVFYPSAYVIHEWQRDSHKKLKNMLMTFTSMFRYFSKWGWKLF